MITLSVTDVNKTLEQVNIHKAAWPDGLPGCLLKTCEDQLSSVFTDIFNLSLTESVISTCFKQTTIVPVPKKAKVTCLNYYRPVPLMSVAMKCFERLVMAHINSILPDTLDQGGQSQMDGGPNKKISYKTTAGLVECSLKNV